MTLARSGEARDVDLHVHALAADAAAEPRAQLRVALQRALAALSDAGAGAADVVAGRLFFAAEPDWPWRDDVAAVVGRKTGLPITALVQPPAVPASAQAAAPACEMLLTAALSSRGRATRVRSRDGFGAAATLERDDGRHVFVAGVTPNADRRLDLPTAVLAADAFARINAVLERADVSFGDVVRTWLVVRDIHQRYEGVNEARDAFFAFAKPARLPASTGIGGALVGSPFGVAVDAYALRPAPGVRVEAMRPAPMGEASDYGRAFARGTLVVAPRRRIAWISGTASVDEHGGVVAPGDVVGQIARTLDNVGGLLDGAGLALADAVSATLYVASAADGAPFLTAARAAGVPESTPTAVVKADICRPEWLCEMELVAARSGG